MGRAIINESLRQKNCSGDVEFQVLGDLLEFMLLDHFMMKMLL